MFLNPSIRLYTHISMNIIILGKITICNLVSFWLIKDLLALFFSSFSILAREISCASNSAILLPVSYHTVSFSLSSWRMLWNEGGEKEEGRGQRILRRSHETRLHVRPPTSNSADANDLSARGAFFLLLFSSLLSPSFSYSRSPLSLFRLSLLSAISPLGARAYSRARNQFTCRDLRRDRRATDHDLDPRHTHRRDKFRATIRTRTSAETRPLVPANCDR